MTPDVTIIIPTRNRAKLLRQSLASALAQTWRNTEVLVLDNASGDDTPAVLQGCPDPALRVIRQPELLPMQENWGCGLKEARGEFAIFLGDDDLLHPNAVESRLQHARKYDASAAFSVHERVNEDASRVLQRVPAQPPAAGPLDRMTALRMALGIEFWIGSTLYRRARALEIWPVLGPDGTGFDVGLNCRLAFRDAAEGKVCFTGVSDIAWRQHGAQATRTQDDTGWDQKMVYLHRLRDEAPDRACSDLLTRSISNWRAWRGWQLALQGGQYGSALSLLGKAISTDPGNLWAWKTAAKWAVAGLPRAGRKPVAKTSDAHLLP